MQIEKLGAFDTSKYDIFMRGAITSREPFVIENNLGRLEYPSQSEADLAFCTVLAVKYKGDAERIESEFRKSPLYRDKWEREDYQQNTIGHAVKTAEKIGTKADPAPLGSAPIQRFLS